MVAAEFLSGIGGLKAAFDLAQGLKNIDDTVRRNAAVIELSEKILAAREAQSALLDRVSALEKEVASFEEWKAEKERYELKEIYPGSFARSIKENARGPEPSHLICTKCYEERKKVILQKSDSVHLLCPECKSRIKFRDMDVRPRSTSRGGWT